MKKGTLLLAFALLVLVTLLTVACDDIQVCPEGQTYETRYTYHYGYNMANGKYEFHLGPETKCWP